MKKIIYTSNAPAPIGPYNQAVLSGNMLYTSGQIAIDPITGNPFLYEGVEFSKVEEKEEDPSDCLLGKTIAEALSNTAAARCGSTPYRSTIFVR